MQLDDNLGTLRRCFNIVKVNKLQKKLEVLTGEKVIEKSKDGLHWKLYEVVIPDDDKPSSSEDANDG